MERQANSGERGSGPAGAVPSPSPLDRVILRVAAVLLGLVVVFGILYYLDRYYQPPTASALERHIQQAEQAVRQNPNSLEARLALARFYLAQERYEASIAQSQQALLLDDKSDEALTTMGLAYLRRHDLPRAKQAFAQVAELVKGSEFAELSHNLQTAHYWLGNIALQEKDYDRAIEELREAVRLRRIDADSHSALGEAYLAQNMLDEASASFEQAVRFVPNYVEAHLGLGAAQERKGSKEKAAEAYRQALKWDAQSLQASEGLARLGVAP